MTSLPTMFISTDTLLRQFPVWALLLMAKMSEAKLGDDEKRSFPNENNRKFSNSKIVLEIGKKKSTSLPIATRMQYRDSQQNPPKMAPLPGNKLYKHRKKSQILSSTTLNHSQPLPNAFCSHPLHCLLYLCRLQAGGCSCCRTGAWSRD